MLQLFSSLGLLTSVSNLPVGTTTFVFRATDLCLNTVEHTFTLTVTNYVCYLELNFFYINKLIVQDASDLKRLGGQQNHLWFFSSFFVI